jgi:hypothetical protein
MGLSVNKEKTKYMVAKCKSHIPHAPHIHISDYNYERISIFVYLGSIVNETNGIKEEISRRIQNANRCYYGLLKHFKSCLLTRETKCRLYTTLVRPVLTYASETWMLTQSDIAHLNTFERKILKKISGPIQEKGEWRPRYNEELYQLYTSSDIVSTIKSGRLRWAGHIKIMSSNDMPLSIMESKPEGRRSVGQPKLRWMDAVLEDLRK